MKEELGKEQGKPSLWRWQLTWPLRKLQLQKISGKRIAAKENSRGKRSGAGQWRRRPTPREPVTRRKVAQGMLEKKVP